jgi:hypothetical protein
MINELVCLETRQASPDWKKPNSSPRPSSRGRIVHDEWLPILPGSRETISPGLLGRLMLALDVSRPNFSIDHRRISPH